MKLSMYILADWLKEYEPKALIRNGDRILTNVRFFTDSLHTDPSCVYIGPMKDFVDTESSQVICVSGQDMILLNTQDANRAFNSIMAAFDYHNRWSEELKDKISLGISLQELLEAAYPVFKSPLLVADPAFSVRARTGMTEEFSRNLNVASVLKNGTMLLDTIIKLNKDPRLRQNLHESYYYNSPEQGFPTLIRNIFRGNTLMGWLVIATQTDPPETSLKHIFEELGDIVNLWVLSGSKKSELASFDEIFPELLEKKDLSEKDMIYFSLIDWKKEDEKFLYVLECSDPEADLSDIRSQLDNYLSGCLSAFYDRNPVIVFNASRGNLKETEKYLETFLAKTRSYAVKSRPFSDCRKIPEYYRVCLKMLKLSEKTPGKIFDLDFLALEYCAFLIRENSQTDISHPALKKLKEYDRKNNTELYKTLRLYLEEERNYVRTAQKLFIHRNSLVYRIKRIEEITGADLEDSYTRLHLLTSYLIEDEDPEK